MVFPHICAPLGQGQSLGPYDFDGLRFQFPTISGIITHLPWIRDEIASALCMKVCASPISTQQRIEIGGDIGKRLSSRWINATPDAILGKRAIACELLYRHCTGIEVRTDGGSLSAVVTIVGEFEKV